jgi:hypothetical protein
MSWKSDQFLPATETVQEVIDQAIGPTITTVRNEHKLRRISPRVEVWVQNAKDNQPSVSLSLAGCLYKGGPKNAELRLHFRRTIDANRLLFIAQLRMDTRDKTSGFAGFTTRGAIKGVDGKRSVTVRPCTRVYNRYNWLNPAAG